MAGEIQPSHGKGAGIIGIFVLIFSLVDFITGFVWVSYGGGDASGIWCGVLLVATGVLGILAWVKLNKTCMIFFMILCIIDIITCLVQAIIAALAYLVWQLLKAVIETSCHVQNGRCDCSGTIVPMNLKDCSWISSIEAIWLTLLIANCLAMIFVFAGSIIGCMSTCCASNPQQPGVIVVQQPGPMIIQQAGLYPSAPPVGAMAVQQGGQVNYTYPGNAGAPAYAQQQQPAVQMYPMSDALPQKA